MRKERTVGPMDAIETLEMYLAAMREGDTATMRELAQRTWLANHESGPDAQDRAPERWEIGEDLRKDLDTFKQFEVTVWDEAGRKGTCRPTVARETGPYAPSIEGAWGVNPISCVIHWENGTHA